LQQFYQAAHEQWRHPCECDGFAPCHPLVASQILYPDDGAGAQVHRGVGPFVDVVHLVELGVWRCEKTEIPDDRYQTA